MSARRQKIIRDLCAIVFNGFRRRIDIALPVDNDLQCSVRCETGGIGNACGRVLDALQKRGGVDGQLRHEHRSKLGDLGQRHCPGDAAGDFDGRQAFRRIINGVVTQRLDERGRAVDKNCRIVPGFAGQQLFDQLVNDQAAFATALDSASTAIISGLAQPLSDRVMPGVSVCQTEPVVPSSRLGAISP